MRQADNNCLLYEYNKIVFPSRGSVPVALFHGSAKYELTVCREVQETDEATIQAGISEAPISGQTVT